MCKMHKGNAIMRTEPSDPQRIANELVERVAEEIGANNVIWPSAWRTAIAAAIGTAERRGYDAAIAKLRLAKHGGPMTDRLQGVLNVADWLEANRP